MNPKLKELVSMGIPIKRASFVKAADTADGSPELRLDCDSHIKSRRAEMYFTFMGLICMQDAGTFIVPLPNISTVWPKE